MSSTQSATEAGFRHLLQRRGGNLLSWYDSGEDGGIRWDPRDEAQTQADQQGGAGFWLQVRRDNGQVGWMQGVMECLGSMDPTEAAARGTRGEIRTSRGGEVVAPRVRVLMTRMHQASNTEPRPTLNPFPSREGR